MRAKNLIVSISLASMVFQPVALAQQKNLNANQALKEFVKANQPGGKPLSYKKFWDQNKKTMNPYWQQVFAPSVNLQKNETLPKMEVINIKGPNGTNTERMIMNIDGKTVSVEFLGGEEKFARINSTVISYADFYYVTGMLEKLSKDPVFVAENKKFQEKILTKSATPTYEQYKKMSVKERAQLLLMTRLAGEAASDVLMIAAQAEGKKTSSHFFWDQLLPEAHASAIGLACLVGGYEGTIVRKSGRTFCDPSEGISSFNSDPKNQKLVQSSGCSGNSFGCHPVNFPASTGICFRKDNRQAMQTMTKQCGERSPYKTPQDQAKLVEAYQKRLGLNTKVDLNADGKVIDEKTYNEVVKPYMDDFNQLNTFAHSNVCNATDRPRIRTVDKEIDSACDTLADRKLSLELFKEAPRPPEPVPTPAPIAGGGEGCKVDGKDGKKDDKGNCIPVAVGAPSQNNCNERGLAEEPAVGKIATREQGEKDPCIVAAATRLPGATTAGPASSSGPSFFNTGAGRFVIGVGMTLGLLALFNWMWNKGKANVAPVIGATPPASPPLPAAPPQPTNPTPAPPISSEGGQGAPAAPIAAPGSQR